MHRLTRPLMMVIAVALLLALFSAGAWATRQTDAATLSGYQVVRESKRHTLNAHYTSYLAQARCPEGKNVIGGGYSAPLSGVGVLWGIESYDGYIAYNGPDKAENAWNVETYVKGRAGKQFTLRSFAVCANTK